MIDKIKDKAIHCWMNHKVCVIIIAVILAAAIIL
jgi:hypothetical protein